MQTLTSTAILAEVTLLSLLLALWMTWMALRGLFRLMPVTSCPATTRMARPIAARADQPHRGARRRAA